MAKPILISGIQPTGRLHLGNYLGALQNFVALQNSKKYDCYFFIADLHSLTGPFGGHDAILNLAADFVAAGIDPKRSVIFQQSQISAHSELGWIFETLTPLGELRRMTQFKDKSGLSQEVEVGTGMTNVMNEARRKMERELTVLTGLLTYPVLQAADILLYDAKFVPVGEDQLQHLELTRTVARKFNAKYGDLFIEPKEVLTAAPRVMSLKDPAKKMSKSDPAGCLFLDDSPEVIREKLARATTDSGRDIKYDQENKAGVSNLLRILSAISGKSIEKLEAEFAGRNYSEFKRAVSDAVAEHFADYREKKAKLMKKKNALASLLKAGSAKAKKKADKKMAETKKKLGLI